MSKTARAGLRYPVGRINRHLRKGKYGQRISTSAAVMMAAVVEYLSAEVLELAGNIAMDHRKNRITPRHIYLGIKLDEELSRHLDDVTIHEGGVLPTEDVKPPKKKKNDPIMQ
uniref:Histone H2A n=2 Tax=Lotharella globosa TaxID=91324 RepID=A0A7S3ZAQ5_9EUKA